MQYESMVKQFDRVLIPSVGNGTFRSFHILIQVSMMKRDSD